MLNFFELMGIDSSFKINEEQLQHNFRQLQTQYHPDNLGKAAQNQALTHLKPAQLSAVINEAYQTLILPDTRAQHLLALRNINIAATDPIRDLDFLDEAMAFRIALDEADSTQLADLQDQLNDWLTEYANGFDKVYQRLLQDNLNTDLTHQAIETTQKLQFLVKLERDVLKKRDELAAISDSDDDLYV